MILITHVDKKCLMKDCKRVKSVVNHQELAATLK